MATKSSSKAKATKSVKSIAKKTSPKMSQPSKKTASKEVRKGVKAVAKKTKK